MDQRNRHSRKWNSTSPRVSYQLHFGGYACWWMLALVIAAATWPVGTYADEPRTASVVTEKVSFKFKGESRDELGEVIVQAKDGGKLFLTADGQLWMLQPSDILGQAKSEQSLEAYSNEEILALLRPKLAPGFLMHKTSHFVLVYNTSETYARWVGDLYERLFKAFYNYWDKRGLKLEPPRFPLVAVVFDTRDAYMQYARPEVGESAAAMIGYYNMQTNRIVSFDITGIQGLAQPGQRYSSREMLNQLFLQPQAERTVATVVHEAVHQIAYNSGLQVRLADNPKWVSEGMAMFFEAPDIKNPRGWGTIGKINNHQLMQFRQYLGQRPSDSLTTLISDDKRFGDKDSVVAAYAESWALTYYLLKAQEKEYVAYMKELGQLRPLGESQARERVELFQKHFGDISKLDESFVNFMRRQRL